MVEYNCRGAGGKDEDRSDVKEELSIGSSKRRRHQPLPPHQQTV
jgi:hypothetical protein